MRSSPKSSAPRWLAPLAAVAIAAVGSTTTVFASAFAAGAVVRVPDSPLATGSAVCQKLVAQQTALGSHNNPGAEVEPFITADPTNPMHLVGSFQQDRWNDGGSNGDINVVSFNGGATWQLATKQPAFSICEGATPGTPGFLNRATDPWVSFSSDGKIVYSISDSFNANGPGFGGTSAILISRSTDGGVTWQTPVAAEVDTSVTVLNDKESVKADPVKPNNAYAVWDRLVSPTINANPTAFLVTPAFRGPAMFSRTTDGGATWSPGRVIFDPGEKDQTIGNQVVIPTAGPAKGQLIDGFDLITTKGGKGEHQSETDAVAIIRSADGGNTWSGPTVVASEVVAHVFIAGKLVRSSDELPEFASGPEGNLYAVWQDARFSPTGTSKIAFSMSTDGGATWSAPIRIDQSVGDTPAFVPQVAVASDGTVGLPYYDLEHSTAAQPGLADAFLAHCHSSCANPASWATNGETRLSNSGSFDYTTAPVTRGFFLGDYDGLVATGTTFRAFFDMSQPIATAGKSDRFSNTAH